MINNLKTEDFNVGSININIYKIYLNITIICV